MTKWLGLHYFQDMDAWLGLSQENRRALLILDRMLTPKKETAAQDSNNLASEMREYYEKQGIKVDDDWLKWASTSSKTNLRKAKQSTEDSWKIKVG